MLGAARPRPPAPTPLLPGALRGLYARLDGLPLSRSKRRLARDFSDGGAGPEAEADLAGRTQGWGACEVLTTPEQGVRGAPEGVAERGKGEEAEMGPRGEECGSGGRRAVHSTPSLGSPRPQHSLGRMRPTRGPLQHLLGPQPASCSPLPGAATPQAQRSPPRTPGLTHSGAMGH